MEGTQLLHLPAVQLVFCIMSLCHTSLQSAERDIHLTLPSNRRTSRDPAIRADELDAQLDPGTVQQRTASSKTVITQDDCRFSEKVLLRCLQGRVSNSGKSTCYVL